MYGHSVPWPRLDEIKRPILEIELFAGEVAPDPVQIDETVSLPQHDGVKGNTKIRQSGGVYGRKESSVNAVEKTAELEPDVKQ